MNTKSVSQIILPVLFAANLLFGAGESLPSLVDGKVPQTFEALWAGYDPRKEPLETEVLKEWEEDGVVLRVVRYQVGVFKGKKVMMAAIYGFPKGGKHLPALLQMHGGGQYADYKAPLTNAKRGYATISLAWAGRISAPGYGVDSDIVNLFIEGKTNDPAYKLTTDWKGFIGYHAVERKNRPPAVYPEWTLDDGADSPRNSSWFMWEIGARRALTFLEQQPEVDGSKLGVYGHSMGGKLTVMTAAADPRVKAAAPSCGGVSARSAPSDSPAPIDDGVSLSHITCPIIFLNPANDFHGQIDDLQTALTEIHSKDWRVTCSAHGNHQDRAEFEVATQLWFDQYLKGTFQLPATPTTKLELKTTNAVPCFTVTPDASRAIQSVDIYYTQQGRMQGLKHGMNHTMNRFWHCAKAIRNGNTWSAELPLLTLDKPLWVYANVLYTLDQPVTGAGYYYGKYTTQVFNLSSRMAIVSPDELNVAGVRATAQPSLLIEAFGPGWEKEWFTYDMSKWARSTHKVYDPQWQAPEGAQLAFAVRSAQPNKLVVSLGGLSGEVSLQGGSQWQQVVLTLKDFRDAKGNALKDWKGIQTLELSAQETLKAKVDGVDKKVVLGGDWVGEPPEFKDLRWVETDRMKWFREARFGLFIHWGVYAVPAGVWKGKSVVQAGEWIKYTANIPTAEYKEFGKGFTAANYDPKAWARLARTAGMKYVVITSKHHDGFALFDSAASDWNAVKASAAGRDLLAPLAAAVRAEGLKFGCYYSQVQDWTNPGGAFFKGGKQYPPAQPGEFDEYLKKTALPQVREVLDRYQPDIFWWDTPGSISKERAQPFADLLAQHPSIISNDRLGGGFEGDTLTPEQHIPPRGYPGKMFEVCMTMNSTWGFKTSDTRWKSVRDLLRNLSDISSKGGNFLLNVGPTADGCIPEASVERLEAVGRWMQVNGEAIYATEATPFMRRMTWGRITQKVAATGATTLYLHVWDWPKDGRLVLAGLSQAPSAATLLANRVAVTAQPTAEGLVVNLPEKATDPIISVVRLQFTGAVTLNEYPLDAEGRIVLTALDGDGTGGRHGNFKVRGSGADAYQADWKDAEWILDYRVTLPTAGSWQVSAEFASAESAKLILSSGTLSAKVTVPAAKAWYTEVISTLDLPAGEQTLRLQGEKDGWNAGPNVRRIWLKPARK